ncbi:MAG TPA: sarcosine oxidase subunit gamma, partial [Paracoccus sp.]|nr:sarcosine oxidase subunit gamma [Paracoccus sp. (in: a-proteobacteria)]
MAAVNAVLQPLGLRFPAPGECLAQGGWRLCWAGRETGFLLGGAAPAGLRAHAAVGDQSDGWAGLRLEGEDCVDVLARLVPLDLRPASFAPGSSLRAPLKQMPALFVRVSGQTFDIFVFR